jgi:dihydropyrimidinase
MIDMIIKNGSVVTPGATYQADIAIDEGKIAAAGSAALFGKARRVIDAAGNYILPGLIDAHTHLEAPLRGCAGALDFYRGSIAGAFGGVTTLIDFTNAGSTLLGSVKARLEEMDKCAIDHSVHVSITSGGDQVLSEIGAVVDYGCPSFKFYTTYKKEGFMLDDEGLLRAFAEIRRCGGLPGVHAESDAIAQANIARFRAAGTLGWRQHAESKPQICELEAVQRVILFARYVGTPLYIFHLTSAAGLETLRRAQGEGQAVYAETCSHYLALTREKYDGPDGIIYVMSPPLRDQEDRLALWDGIGSGSICAVNSDECSYEIPEKGKFLDRDEQGGLIPDFTRVAHGVPGIEERLPVLISEGVNQGRISLNRLVEITSCNQARIFGMYPRNGAILPGSDADLVILDPERSRPISAQTMHQGLSYSIYEGRPVQGWPVMTLSRGEVIVEQGEFTGKRGAGRIVKRQL